MIRPPDRQPIQAILLLAGLVRPTDLSQKLRRSVLDLPVDAERTLLDFWLTHRQRLAEALNWPSLPLRILVNHRVMMPNLPGRPGVSNVHVEQDKAEYRGTAGALRDLVEGYEDDDHVLVATAGQVLRQPLEAVLRMLASRESDICLGCHQDGTPAGFMRIRCGSIRRIPAVGYIDFKEQALPRIAKQCRVTTARSAEPLAMPVRTREDYLRMLFIHHRPREGELQNPFAERWRRSFRIVEPGGQVAASARIHNSVVLSGGVVAEEGTVVDSVVCPGGTVRRGETIVGEVVGASGRPARSHR